MYGDRGVSMLVLPEQWARCAHDGTALLAEGGVQLDWADPDPTGGACGESGASPEPAGLAFDDRCGGYRSWPTQGWVERLPVGAGPRRERPAAPCPGAFRHPRGLAVDASQRLYVAEPAGHSVVVVDLVANRVLRRLPFPGLRPVDVASDPGGGCTWALTSGPAALFSLDGRRGPRPGPRVVPPRCHPGLRATRVTRGPLLLWTGPAPDPCCEPTGLICHVDGTVVLEVPGATDCELGVGGLLIVSRAPGQPFRRFQQLADRPRTGPSWLELEPLGAPDFDGGAVATRPDGRTAFTTAAGVGATTGSVARHERRGTVTTYRLDSGVYQTRWGRIFVDACLPAHTDLRLRALTSDLDEVTDPLEATPARRGVLHIPHPELTPPLPPQSLLAEVAPARGLFRRPPDSDGRARDELGQPVGKGLVTYEGPVDAPPGRYLWLELQLSGTDQVTPRVHALRVERPGHRLLNSLPLMWSRGDAQADFLQRYLAPMEGLLHELDWRAVERAVLVDPYATPEEALGWLAGFAGLVLDRRWPEDAQRTLLAEAYQLFTRRGTKDALARLLEIYLGRAPVIVEEWQLRGLGGAVLGTVAGGSPAPAVGGATASGTLGRSTIGGGQPGTDAYRSSAHRFCVLVSGSLSPEQREVVGGLLADHRPAHTLVGLIELGSGMRVGSQSRLALTTFVGPGTTMRAAVTGQLGLGRDGVIGVASLAARVGHTSVAGKLRVG